MTEIVAPFAQFFDTSGAPLANGAIYIGIANLDAESNPIAVFWDEALTIPAAQPIRTLNGYIVNSGTPARLYSNAANYSVTVRDNRGRILYSVHEVTSATLITDFQATLAGPTGSSLVGFLQSGAGAVARTAQSKFRETVSVKDYGAVGDGIANDTAAFQSALNYAVASQQALYIPAGTYRLTARLNASAATKTSIIGDGRRISNLCWDAGATDGGGINITYTDWLFPPTVSGLSLITKGAGTGTSLKITGQDAPSVTVLGPDVTDIEIIGNDRTINCWSVGIQFVLCWYISLQRVSIKGLEQAAPPFTQAAGIILTDCQVIFASEFSIIHVTDAVLEQNVSAVRGEGFSFSDFELVGVTNGFTMIAGAVAPGVNIGPGHINSYAVGINLANQYQTSIHDILFYKAFNSTSDYVGIQMQNCNSNLVHDNQFHGWLAATGNTIGIILTGTGASDDNIVHDNAFRNFNSGASAIGIIVSSGAGKNYVHNNNGDSTVQTVVQVDPTAEKNNLISRNFPTIIQTFSVNAATPSVGNDLNGQWNTANPNPTSITNFLDGYTSQIITVLVNDANTTFQHNAGLIMRNGANYSPPIGALVTFRRDATLWREVSRSE